MKIPGAGASSSKTSAEPTFRSTIAVAACRSVCDGPTVTETSDIPSLTCIATSSRTSFPIVRIDANVPDA